MLQLCVCRVIEHLGSLESTQEARVAQGNSCASFILSKLPACIHTTGYKHTKHEEILKFNTELKVTILLISPFTCNMW